MTKDCVNILMVVLMVCVGLCVISVSSQAAEPILIGINQDITGLMAAEGRTHTDSAQMAIDEWNAKGGINGRQIKAVFMNNGADPVRAAANAKSMVKQGVVVVLGCSNSTLCAAEMKEFARANIPVSGGAASLKSSLEKGANGKPYFFTAVGADPVYAKGFLDAAAAQGYKKIAILQANIAWPKEFTAVIQELVKKEYGPKHGMSILGIVDLDINATDLSLQVHKLKQLNPDAIITAIYQSNCLALTRAFANAKWNPPWINGWSQIDAVYAKSSDKKMFYNAIGVSYWDGSRPDTMKKHAEYVKKYGYEPTAHWATTYETMNLFMTAIKEVGTDGKKIHEWMATKAYGKPLIAGKKGMTCKYQERNETWLGTPTTFYSLFDGSDYGRVWINQKGEMDWKTLK